MPKHKLHAASLLEIEDFFMIAFRLENRSPMHLSQKAKKGHGVYFPLNCCSGCSPRSASSCRRNVAPSCQHKIERRSSPRTPTQIERPHNVSCDMYMYGCTRKFARTHTYSLSLTHSRWVTIHTPHSHLQCLIQRNNSLTNTHTLIFALHRSPIHSFALSLAHFLSLTFFNVFLSFSLCLSLNQTDITRTLVQSCI